MLYYIILLLIVFLLYCLIKYDACDKLIMYKHKNIFKNKDLSMGKYKIADLIIEVNPKYLHSEKLMKNYEYSGAEKPVFTVNVTDEMIAYEGSISEQDYPDFYYDFLAILRCICLNILKNFNGFFFHCSSLELDGKAYLFTAHSGTGKSTHTRLWREYFGDKVTMINDDKPIIRLINGRFYIYGTPWQGKENIGNNVKVPVHAVCFLRQGKDNKIKKLTPIEALPLFFDQTERPKDKKSMENLLDLFNLFLKEIPIYMMDCTISEDAVITAYKEMSK